MSNDSEEIDVTAGVRCASALSTAGETDAALNEVVEAASTNLDGPPDLAVLFVSPHHAANIGEMAADLCQRLDCVNLLGCTGESIVGVGKEIEGDAAVSLFLARLPGVQVELTHLHFDRESRRVVGVDELFGRDAPAEDAWLLLGEPFTFPADGLLEELNESYPGCQMVGGMASGGHAPGMNRLLMGTRQLDEGAVVARLSGPVRVRSVTSQGCRPIGSHFVITKAEQNVIWELGGLPAMERLKEVFAELPARDQKLVNHGLHVGRVMNEYQERFEQGDFLIKNVIGADPDKGAIAIGDYVRVGQTVQFHVRDEASADADLRQLLAAACDGSQGAPAGGLLFTCNGRGTRLFSEPHHDAAAIAETLGDIPLAGFFAQGEIGPVANKNFIHGFTASLALFETRPPETE